MKKLIGLVVVLMLACPLGGLVGVAALVTTVASSCGSLVVGTIPDSLTAQTMDGRSVTLEREQLTHAATIITVGGQTADVGRAGVIVALIAALAESTLRLLANISAYPESASYPHDGDSSDHDSLGLFQMRPSSGWGTVAELMDPSYQARAFFGGVSGPNAGAPRGLLDVTGWQMLDPGAAAQAVEVSAYPDRFANYEPVAEAILVALTRSSSVVESSRVVFPLPAGSYTNTDSFGWRIDPYTGERRFHAGSDLAAPLGTPILAVADGVVSFAGQRGTYGGLITIEHTVGGERVTSHYAHMYEQGMHVAASDSVVAGQHIGDVGSAGKSTGPHLHLEIHPGGASEPAINAVDWLTAHGAADLTEATSGCPVA
ncbi:M23 family metallopeptidase [Cryobacterium sp. Hh38]|uniref:M23 family metallopeptidase n=1 Tax=Cryobacterium sp. Hh38 TaxID=1259156 RepID=UPI00106AB47E|nr:M23 family metallopeptidase [Cryobacterium sp. Hh38]TFD59596.1 M23 family metallopeptidase [Cryobacterium sp. Hh38]